MFKKSSALFLFTFLIFSACNQNTAEDVHDEIVDKVNEESAGSLVIYSGRQESLVSELINSFSAETGVVVEVRYAKSSSLAGTLSLEGAMSPADVFLSQDPLSLSIVANEDLFEILPQNILKNIPAWAVDPNGYWVGISGRSRALVVDKRDVSDAELPEEIYGLNSENFRGRLGLAPTNSSFIAMVSCMMSQDGEEKVFEWLTGINSLEYTEYPKNSPQVAAAAAGELDIGMINHYYTLRTIAEAGDITIKNVFLKRGCGAMVMPSGVGILSSSKNKVAAISFVEYLHSKSAQEHFTNSVFEFPLVTGITPNVLLPDTDSLNSPQDLDWSALVSWQDKAVELIAKAGF